MVKKQILPLLVTAALISGGAMAEEMLSCTYIDQSLRVVVQTPYEWGWWPFEEGTALVCRGCQLGGGPGEEHRPLVGGKWGYLDTAGREVVPVRHTREKARALRGEL